VITQPSCYTILKDDFSREDNRILFLAMVAPTGFAAHFVRADPRRVKNLNTIKEAGPVRFQRSVSLGGTIKRKTPP
jgi:hypothetical protein